MKSTQVINTSTHYEESYTQFVEHFRNHKHDLVFASYDKEGVAVVNAAIDNNISIPDDMEVMAMMVQATHLFVDHHYQRFIFQFMIWVHWLYVYLLKF